MQVPILLQTLKAEAVILVLHIGHSCRASNAEAVFLIIQISHTYHASNVEAVIFVIHISHTHPAFNVQAVILVVCAKTICKTKTHTIDELRRVSVQRRRFVRLFGCRATSKHRLASICLLRVQTGASPSTTACTRKSAVGFFGNISQFFSTLSEKIEER